MTYTFRTTRWNGVCPHILHRTWTSYFNWGRSQCLSFHTGFVLVKFRRYPKEKTSIVPLKGTPTTGLLIQTLTTVRRTGFPLLSEGLLFPFGSLLLLLSSFWIPGVNSETYVSPTLDLRGSWRVNPLTQTLKRKKWINPDSTQR